MVKTYVKKKASRDVVTTLPNNHGNTFDVLQSTNMSLPSIDT